jgi:peptidoglycan/LPS O-acetylase OafA/YrhL
MNAIRKMEPKQKNLQLIQLLRGIASMLVVLLHITNNSQVETGYNWLWGSFMFGGSGVDIFFVLSGFIIAYANWKYIGTASYVGHFLKRRFIRVYPIYWLVISVFLFFQLALPAFYNSHFDTGWINLLKTYLLLPDHIMLNGVSWSLTNEIFFYLVFTVAFLIPNKKYSLVLLIICFVALITASFFGGRLAGSNAFTQLFLFSMNIEFLLGVCIVVIVKSIPKRFVYPLLFTGIIYFITAAVLNNSGIVVTSIGAQDALNRVLLFGIPSFLIILSLVKLELEKTVTVKNIFLQLGDASYSIYLIHLPIVAASFKLIAKLHIQNELLLFLLLTLLFAGVCFLGIAVYNKIEKPLIKKLNKALL